MMNPSISIVIPLYNKELRIGECLTSILNQTVQPNELIIIDDGSTDLSLDVVESTLSDYIGTYRVVKQSNAGVSVARNTGGSLSSSDFIAFIDADDEWCHEYLENVKSLIVEFPDADLYCLGHKIYDPEIGVFIPKQGLSHDYRGYVDDYFMVSSKGPIVNSSTAIVRKESLLDIGGFPHNVKAGEDLFVWMMLALQGRVVFDGFNCALIYQEKDKSRSRRVGLVPYPLMFFSKKENIKMLTASVKTYLWQILFIHALGSLADNNYREFFSRIRVGLHIFPFKSLLLIPFALVPPQIMLFLKKYRRNRTAVHR